MLGATAERPVDDKFVIDDDMDSDTVTESNLSLKSRSFLNRVNARQRQTFKNLGNVYVFDIGSICIHGKELLRNFYIPSNVQGMISL